MRAKRDRSYYQNRLVAEHPGLAKDVADGKIKFWDAVDQAGLKKRPKASNLLRTAWRKASSAERQDFMDWLADTQGVPIATPGKAPSSVPKTVSSPIKTLHAGAATLTDADNRLTASAQSAIKDILKSRGLKAGDLMREIGERPLDPSVAPGSASEQEINESRGARGAQKVAERTWPSLFVEYSTVVEKRSSRGSTERYIGVRPLNSTGSQF